MTNAELLDDLLTSLGYPRADGVALEAADIHVSDKTVYEGRRALFEPLRLRGWCAHFDSEGHFFGPQQHSKLIAALLTLAGVHPLPEIRDAWVQGAGWVMEIRTESRHVGYHFRDLSRDLPSDFCELGLIRTLVNDWLAPDRTLVDFPTGDQTAFCCVMPKSVYDELCEWGFIATSDAINLDHGELGPSPDQLVLWPSEEVAAYLENVVVLTSEQANAMVANTPGDWLSR